MDNNSFQSGGNVNSNVEKNLILPKSETIPTFQDYMNDINNEKISTDNKQPENKKFGSEYLSNLYKSIDFGDMPVKNETDFIVSLLYKDGFAESVHEMNGSEESFSDFMDKIANEVYSDKNIYIDPTIPDDSRDALARVYINPNTKFSDGSYAIFGTDEWIKDALNSTTSGIHKNPNDPTEYVIIKDGKYKRYRDGREDNTFTKLLSTAGKVVTKTVASIFDTTTELLEDTFGSGTFGADDFDNTATDFISEGSTNFLSYKDREISPEEFQNMSFIDKNLYGLSQMFDPETILNWDFIRSEEGVQTLSSTLELIAPGMAGAKLAGKIGVVSGLSKAGSYVDDAVKLAINNGKRFSYGEQIGAGLGKVLGYSLPYTILESRMEALGTYDKKFNLFSKETLADGSINPDYIADEEERKLAANEAALDHFRLGIPNLMLSNAVEAASMMLPFNRLKQFGKIGGAAGVATGFALSAPTQGLEELSQWGIENYIDEKYSIKGKDKGLQKDSIFDALFDSYNRSIEGFSKDPEANTSFWTGIALGGLQSGAANAAAKAKEQYYKFKYRDELSLIDSSINGGFGIYDVDDNGNKTINYEKLSGAAKQNADLVANLHLTSGIDFSNDKTSTDKLTVLLGERYSSLVQNVLQNDSEGILRNLSKEDFKNFMVNELNKGFRLSPEEYEKKNFQGIRYYDWNKISDNTLSNVVDDVYNLYYNQDAIKEAKESGFEKADVLRIINNSTGNQDLDKLIASKSAGIAIGKSLTGKILSKYLSEISTDTTGSDKISDKTDDIVTIKNSQYRILDSKNKDHVNNLIDIYNKYDSLYADLIAISGTNLSEENKKKQTDLLNRFSDVKKYYEDKKLLSKDSIGNRIKDSIDSAISKFKNRKKINIDSIEGIFGKKKSDDLIADEISKSEDVKKGDEAEQAILNQQQVVIKDSEDISEEIPQVINSENPVVDPVVNSTINQTIENKVGEEVIKADNDINNNTYDINDPASIISFILKNKPADTKFSDFLDTLPQEAKDAVTNHLDQVPVPKDDEFKQDDEQIVGEENFDKIDEIGDDIKDIDRFDSQDFNDINTSDGKNNTADDLLSDEGNIVTGFTPTTLTFAINGVNQEFVSTGVNSYRIIPNINENERQLAEQSADDIGNAIAYTFTNNYFEKDNNDVFLPLITANVVRGNKVSFFKATNDSFLRDNPETYKLYKLYRENIDKLFNGNSEITIEIMDPEYPMDTKFAGYVTLSIHDFNPIVAVIDGATDATTMVHEPLWFLKRIMNGYYDKDGNYVPTKAISRAINSNLEFRRELEKNIAEKTNDSGESIVSGVITNKGFSNFDYSDILDKISGEITDSRIKQNVDTTKNKSSDKWERRADSAFLYDEKNRDVANTVNTQNRSNIPLLHGSSIKKDVTDISLSNGSTISAKISSELINDKNANTIFTILDDGNGGFKAYPTNTGSVSNQVKRTLAHLILTFIRPKTVSNLIITLNNSLSNEDKFLEFENNKPVVLRDKLKKYIGKFTPVVDSISDVKLSDTGSIGRIGISLNTKDGTVFIGNENTTKNNESKGLITNKLLDFNHNNTVDPISNIISAIDSFTKPDGRKFILPFTAAKPETQAYNKDVPIVDGNTIKMIKYEDLIREHYYTSIEIIDTSSIKTDQKNIGFVAQRNFILNTKIGELPAEIPITNISETEKTNVVQQPKSDLGEDVHNTVLDQVETVSATPVIEPISDINKSEIQIPTRKVDITRNKKGRNFNFTDTSATISNDKIIPVSDLSFLDNLQSTIMGEIANELLTATLNKDQVINELAIINRISVEKLEILADILDEHTEQGFQYKLMELNPELAKERIKAQLERIKAFEPTLKEKPVNINAKFPKDQVKANYVDGIIGYGTHSTGNYANAFGGTRTSFKQGDIIMISVNGNNRPNQKENVEKTKQAIDKAISQGVVAFIADNETIANSSHNSGGEGVIRNYMLSKGLVYKQFKGVGLYVVNRANVSDSTIDRFDIVFPDTKAVSTKDVEMLIDGVNENGIPYFKIFKDRVRLATQDLLDVDQQKEAGLLELDSEMNEAQNRSQMEEDSNRLFNPTKKISKKEKLLYNSLIKESDPTGTGLFDSYFNYKEIKPQIISTLSVGNDKYYEANTQEALDLIKKSDYSWVKPLVDRLENNSKYDPELISVLKQQLLVFNRNLEANYTQIYIDSKIENSGTAQEYSVPTFKVGPITADFNRREVVIDILDAINALNGVVPNTILSTDRNITVSNILDSINFDISDVNIIELNNTIKNTKYLKEDILNIINNKKINLSNIRKIAEFISATRKTPQLTQLDNGKSVGLFITSSQLGDDLSKFINSNTDEKIKSFSHVSAKSSLEFFNPNTKLEFGISALAFRSGTDKKLSEYNEIEYIQAAFNMFFSEQNGKSWYVTATPADGGTNYLVNFKNKKVKNFNTDRVSESENDYYYNNLIKPDIDRMSAPFIHNGEKVFDFANYNPMKLYSFQNLYTDTVLILSNGLSSEENYYKFKEKINSAKTNKQKVRIAEEANSFFKKELDQYINTGNNRLNLINSVKKSLQDSSDELRNKLKSSELFISAEELVSLSKVEPKKAKQYTYGIHSSLIDKVNIDIFANSALGMTSDVNDKKNTDVIPYMQEAVLSSILANYAVFHNNMQYIFQGDPAHYAKNYNVSDQKTSYDNFLGNLFKRLKSNISPRDIGNNSVRSISKKGLKAMRSGKFDSSNPEHIYDKSTVNHIIAKDTKIPGLNLASILDVMESDLSYERLGLNTEIITKELYDTLDTKGKLDIILKYIKNPQQLFPEIKDYFKVPIADAQEYWHYSYGLDFLEEQGEITNQKKLEIIQRVESDSLTKDDYKYLGVQKPLHVGTRNITDKNGNSVDGNNWQIRDYIKSSAKFLYPQLVKGTEWEDIYNKMESDDVDAITFNSAVKVGEPANTITLFSNNGEYTGVDFNEIITLESKFKGKQLNIPIKDSNKIADPAQIDKKFGPGLEHIIMSDGTPMSTLLDKQESLKAKKRMLEKEKIRKRLSNVDGSLNMQKLYNFLQEELNNRGFENNAKDAIKIIEEIDPDGIIIDTLMYPLHAMTQPKRFDALIASLVTKAGISKGKAPGFGLPQVSSIGLKRKVSVKEITDIENTAIIPIGGWNISKGLSHYNNGTEHNPKGLAEIIIPWIFPYPIENFIKDGKIDLDKLPEDLLEGLSFRIPNQDYSSDMGYKIVGFTKDVNNIFVPHEIAVQMGSDYDIDKLYGMLPDIEGVYNIDNKYFQSKEEIDKRIVLIQNKIDTIVTDNLSIGDKTNKFVEFKNDLTNRKVFTDTVSDLIDTIGNSPAAILVDLKEDLEKLSTVLNKETPDKFRKSNSTAGKVNNELHDIRMRIISHPEVKKRALQALDTGINEWFDWFNESLRDSVESISAAKTYLDFGYQGSKSDNSRVGKTGIGAFSLNGSTIKMFTNRNVTASKYIPLAIEYRDENGNLVTAVNDQHLSNKYDIVSNQKLKEIFDKGFEGKQLVSYLDDNNETQYALLDLYQDAKTMQSYLDEILNNLIDPTTTGIETVLADQNLINELIEDKKANDVDENLLSLVDKQSFDMTLSRQIQDKLQKLYPEIKLNITNNPVWENGDNVFNQEDYDNNVNYSLKAIELLQSDKAKQVFAKGEKNNWDLTKILNELGVSKQQQELIDVSKLDDNKIIYSENKEQKKERLNKRREIVLKEINAIEELINTKPDEIVLYETKLYEYDYQSSRYFDKSNWENSDSKYKTILKFDKNSYLANHLDEELQKRIKNLQVINSSLFNDVESVNYSNIFKEGNSYSSKEILEYIINNKKDVLSGIAEHLLKYSEKNNVEVKIKPEEKRKLGSYFGYPNYIEIYGKNGITSHTLIHEIVHSLSTRYIYDNPNSIPVLELKNILKNILDKKILKEYENNERDYEDYATKNIHELLSEIISRPDILSHLSLYDTNYNLIKGKHKQKSILDSIVKILAEIFNFSKKESETLADLILFNAKDIFEASTTWNDFDSKQNTQSTREQIITDLLANYSYTVEINTAKEKPVKQLSLDSPESFIDDFGNEYTRDYSDTHEGFDYFKNGNLITKQQFDKEYQDNLDDVVENQNTQHYSNLSAPGGTNYTENEISIPGVETTERFDTGINLKIEPFGKSIDNIDILKDGNKIGYVQISKNNSSKILTVTGIELKEKGNGKNVYLELQNQYPSFTIKSDKENLSSDAINMWDSLVKRELATKNGEKDYILNKPKIVRKGAITPSIKGHAQFSTDNGIGWFRSDDKIDTKTGSKTITEYRIGTTEDVIAGLIEPEEVGKYVKIIKNSDLGTTESKTRRILEVQSDLFQKGRDYIDLISGKYSDFNQANNREEYLKYLKESKENQFLQLLNKDNNWVTFFIKSIIQDSAKQTTTEVQESDVEAKVRELEEDGLLEIDCKGLKAKDGLRSNFTKGGKWKLIKDLKGYPTHKEGGVDLTIGKNGVSIKNGNTEFTAKHGLVIPKNIDSLVETLPIAADYAKDGTIVSELYKQKTGKDWSTAKAEGLTDGSYDSNMRLRQKLLNNELTGQLPQNSYYAQTDNSSENQDYTKAKDFNEAFKIARQQLGANQIFEYQGRKYGTNLKGEKFEPSEETLTKVGMNKPEVKERLNNQNKMVNSVYSDKQTAKLEPEYQDWDKVKKRKQEINAMNQADIIRNYHKDKDEEYLLLDKKRGKLHLYKGDKEITSYNVGTGANKGDEQTKTVIRDGKVYWEEGNKMTGAGIYTVSGVNPKNAHYSNAPTWNFINEQGIEVPMAIHSSFGNRTAKIKGNKEEDETDTRLSNGCINGICYNLGDLYKKGYKQGQKLYVLPDDDSNKYELKNGKLVFSSKNSNVNRTVNTLNYKPIKIELDEKTFKEKVLQWNDFNDEEEYEKTTKPFIKSLTDNKQKVMKAAQIDGDTYNDIAKIAFGIYGTESNFGDTHSAIGNLARATNKYFDKSSSSSPDVKSKAGTYGATNNNNSVGYTQIRWSQLNEREIKVLKELGITSNKDFLQPDKAAIATAAILSVRYHEQLTPEQKKDIETYLPAKWNNRSNYSSRVKTNSKYLIIKELN